ncbi:MAG: hypothetical protein KJ648_07490 [Candidatus Omnitrophica bacterium]|nr:hypothetical protein [Candidatus Omnitrophota bacterium]
MHFADLLQILKLNELTAEEALDVLGQLEAAIVRRAAHEKILNKRQAKVPYWARWRARVEAAPEAGSDAVACVIWRRVTEPKPGARMQVELGVGTTWARALLEVLVAHPALVSYPMGEGALELLRTYHAEVKAAEAPKAEEGAAP